MDVVVDVVVRYVPVFALLVYIHVLEHRARRRCRMDDVSLTLVRREIARLAREMDGEPPPEPEPEPRAPLPVARIYRR